MKVTVIAHRGWWKTPEEQNTLAAFARAFDAGIGVELDVRDVWDEDLGTGYLAVSHDPIVTGDVAAKCFPFQKVLDLLAGRDLPLAVNVKSCGLAPLFAKVEKKPPSWFFFDVAPGDEEPYPRHKLPLFKRDVWDADPVLLVSWEILYPDDDPLPYWKLLKANQVNIYLITDRVPEAMEFFK